MDKNVDIASKLGVDVELNSKYSNYSKQGESGRKPKNDSSSLLNIKKSQTENK